MDFKAILSKHPTFAFCHRVHKSVHCLFCCLTYRVVVTIFLNPIYMCSVQYLSRVWHFVTPRTAACQASLSVTNSWSPHKPTSIVSVTPSNRLILCGPLILLPSIFPSIRVFSNGSALRIRWPKYWSFNFNISPSNEHPELVPFGWTGWISLQSKGLSRVFSNNTAQKHQFFCAQLSL